MHSYKRSQYSVSGNQNELQYYYRKKEILPPKQGSIVLYNRRTEEEERESVKNSFASQTQ